MYAHLRRLLRHWFRLIMYHDGLLLFSLIQFLHGGVFVFERVINGVQCFLSLQVCSAS